MKDSHDSAGARDMTPSEALRHLDPVGHAKDQAEIARLKSEEMFAKLQLVASYRRNMLALVGLPGGVTMDEALRKIREYRESAFPELRRQVSE
ncbi:MAG: hypothetical protein PHX87_01290 [Candidatus Peribacteraceae bacterium]|nr:hypothetical protein [Candidatus Peribacteraceae bacterium]MDD5742043.1 hypothetical protein [Candidatus Peribacteraceae bacterium]